MAGDRSDSQEAGAESEVKLPKMNLAANSSNSKQLDEHEIRQIALEEADAVLPQELAMMLSNDIFLEICVMCGLDDKAESQALARALAEKLVDVIWSPPAGCVSRVFGWSKSELQVKLQLFWRCAVALCRMPTGQLEILTERKKPFLCPENCENQVELIPKDIEPALIKLAHIRLNLPIFSMLASLPSEAENENREKDASASETQQVSNGTRAKTSETDADNSDSEDEDDDGSSKKNGNTGNSNTGNINTGNSNSNHCSSSDSSTFRPAKPAVQVSEKSKSAARHTYDVGYKKWESFDVDAALAEADVEQVTVNKASIVEPTAARPLVEDPSADPVDMIDAGLSRLRRGHQATVDETPSTSGGPTSEQQSLTTAAAAVPSTQSLLEPSAPIAASAPAALAMGSTPTSEKPIATATTATTATTAATATTATGPTTPNETSTTTTTMASKSSTATATATATPTAAASTETTAARSDSTEQGQIQTAQNSELPAHFDVSENGATATKLAADYSKWDNFEEDHEELDELDDDHLVPSGGTDFDLDAVTGPKEEVMRIQSHWRRESRRISKASKAQTQIPRRSAPAAPSITPAEHVQERPCEYRACDDPEAASAKAISRNYDRWKTFDADAALLELENEGTSTEGTAMRMNSSKGSAMLNCEGYTKDREEYELDQDIEKHMASLKKALAQSVRDASNLKAEGNDLLRTGRADDAALVYKKGLEIMELGERSSILMADSMAGKQNRLIGDLYRNLAAAQLASSDFQGALSSCDEAIKRGGDENDDKARYRRATALFNLGRLEEASAEVDSLANSEDPSIRKLKAGIASAKTGGSGCAAAAAASAGSARLSNMD
eukprot:TRINITY_DN7887_c1_g1_i2.p1 TRINITY_DN7887_c1_g1~~TRINITY_DN7887_c1_g1_i2.p1  ORF type:complete len:858 (-),score=221.63 TRINITY_DN7887_c1_g1_i2:144-2684(-)